MRRPSNTLACGWMYTAEQRRNRSGATPRENELAFVFSDEHGAASFTTTFIYDPKTNTWDNRLDNVAQGVAKPFARFNLTKQ